MTGRPADRPAVAAGEWFTDAAGGPGSGHALSGPFGRGPGHRVGDDLGRRPGATLTDGPHAVLVRGRDASGNWGPTSSTVLVIDRLGPTGSAASLSPDPTLGSASATLSATITDGMSVTAAEWFTGAQPGPGAATAAVAADGAFDTVRETIRAAIPLAGRPFGEMIVSYRGRDAAGTWGPARPSYLGTGHAGRRDLRRRVESGTTGRWTSATASGSLTVTAPAAMAGRWGLAIAIRSGVPAYLTDSSPNALAAYHAGFGFDARGLKTLGTIVDIFTGLDPEQRR